MDIKKELDLEDASGQHDLDALLAVHLDISLLSSPHGKVEMPLPEESEKEERPFARLLTGIGEESSLLSDVQPLVLLNMGYRAFFDAGAGFYQDSRELHGKEKSADGMPPEKATLLGQSDHKTQEYSNRLFGDDPSTYGALHVTGEDMAKRAVNSLFRKLARVAVAKKMSDRLRDDAQYSTPFSAGYVGPTHSDMVLASSLGDDSSFPGGYKN